MMKAVAVIILILAGAIVLRFLYLGRQSQSMTLSNGGVQNGQLSPCPDKPNCVCSQAPTDSSHYLKPLQYKGDVSAVKNKILNQARENGWSITSETSDYLHFEVSSRLFGFTDDLEFYFPAEAPGIIHVRSASRVGKSDLGVNRKRVEALRLKIEPDP